MLTEKCVKLNINRREGSWRRKADFGVETGE